MGKFGTKDRMEGVHEKAGSLGSVKPTSPPIRKLTGAGPQDKYSLQRDSIKAEAKFNRGAVKPWVPKGRSKVVSKGSSDVVGAGPSKKVGRGPGYDGSKGYVNR